MAERQVLLDASVRSCAKCSTSVTGRKEARPVCLSVERQSDVNTETKNTRARAQTKEKIQKNNS